VAATRLLKYLRQIEARTWVELVMALLMVLALVFFSQILVGPQVVFGSDRVELMLLRDLWVESAVGFGVRSEQPSREEFLSEYRRFRARPSVRKLLLTDPPFSTLMSKADAAFARLETGEIRGDLGAAQEAIAFDAALAEMSKRVGDYAQDQFAVFRSFFLVILTGMIAAIVGFVVLEVRLRASSVGEARNRALSRALIAAQEGERLRISRELHDAVAQDLAAAKLYCGLCAESEAVLAKNLLEHAIDEIRNICYGLRPAELDRLGIAEAGARLCTDIAKETGIQISFSVDGLAGLELEPETEINIYRILQEALSNVRRHSGARHVKVRLVGFGGYVELTVEDDGKGPGDAAPGLGRTGMEERARMIGGRFRFGYGPWGGSSLRVTVPGRRIKENT
jgi:signal transduction histidine kinase